MNPYEITVEELAAGNHRDYLLVDMRNDRQREYGEVEGSIRVLPEELEAYPFPPGKTAVLICARGVVSEEYAERLREEKGVDARSLSGGYPAWLRAGLQKQTPDEVAARVEQSLKRRFRDKLTSKFTKALKEYRMISPGDKIAVCISGGKDSMLMAKLFQELSRYSEVPFEAKFLVMDPGYNRENRQILEENARNLKIPITVFESNIFESVYEVEKSPCYLCARMRRGYLYRYAKELGCNKIALGHHYDDVIETVLMGMLYGAQIQTMMPKLHSTNFEGMELIRPLYLIREEDIKAWRDANGLHFLQCACKFTDTCASCDTQNRSKRQEVKELIRDIKKVHPNVEKCIFKSVENVSLDAVIAYKKGGVRHHFLEDYDQRARSESGAPDGPTAPESTPDNPEAAL